MDISKAAMYWEANGEDVQCRLCPHNCKIANNKVGICTARKNVNGNLYTMNYGMLASISLDPIEKKPLYRFYPGSKILSVGTYGCNFKCQFCQNYQISQEHPETIYIESKLLIDKALEFENNIGIAFTYNEPSIWFEFVLDTCKLSKKEGLKNVLVSNGFINKEPLEELLDYVDAMNIDVKAFNEKFYQEICNGNLESVKRTVEIASKKCHIELTSMIIPGVNDSQEEIEQMCEWIASINKEIPLHLSRYFPNYKMNIKNTPAETVVKLQKIAQKYLNYVYLGNV